MFLHCPKQGIFTFFWKEIVLGVLMANISKESSFDETKQQYVMVVEFIQNDINNELL